MIDEKLLKNEERAVYTLRNLYRSYGYRPYKMSKFEEYELYLRNKDFLVSDRIITFNDTNGKLMALKPDVTLSIIKNGEDVPGCKQKLCYNENVYRVSGSTRQYKEIMQAGLECIGDLDLYDIFEALYLAGKSLSLISPSYVLDLSHLGLLTALLDGISQNEQLRQRISHCIAEKNSHDLERICREADVDEAKIRELCFFAGIYGELGSVIGQLEPLCVSELARAALEELKQLHSLLSATEIAGRVFFDFSVVNDMNYYNGIVFKGFLEGICEGVLAGGLYDKLMRRMGRSSRALGFALYLDLLEELRTAAPAYDVDVLLLYDEQTQASRVAAKVRELAEAGQSVSAQRAVPEKLRCRQLLDLRGGAEK